MDRQVERSLFPNELGDQSIWNVKTMIELGNSGTIFATGRNTNDGGATSLGLLRSTDGGISWSEYNPTGWTDPQSSGMGGVYGDVKFRRLSDGTLLAAYRRTTVEPYILRSANGATWSTINVGRAPELLPSSTSSTWAAPASEPTAALLSAPGG